MFWFPVEDSVRDVKQRMGRPFPGRRFRAETYHAKRKLRRTRDAANDARCQFQQHFKSSFCADNFAPKSTNLKCNYKKAAHKTFAQKSCAQNVGEIDSRLHRRNLRSNHDSAIKRFDLFKPLIHFEQGKKL